MMADVTALALVALLLPAVSFLILAVVVPLRRLGRPAAYVSLLCAGGALAAAALAWRGAAERSRLVWDWIPAEAGPLATIGVLVDHDSTSMLLLVALVAFLVQLYSIGYLSDELPYALGRYYTYQSLFAFSMMALVLAPNFVQLFIAWELVGLSSYLLIGFWYHKPAAARAAVKAFWTTKLGDVGLLIGIVMLWRHTGTFDLTELQAMVNSGTVAAAGLSVMTFCIYLGAVGKSAQFPLHIWLPDAMEGPTPVSALIHAATMVTAGVYLLHRTSWLFALTPEVLAIVVWIGALTALLAAVLACVQDDIKRVLAYSTVSQLGYMMAAIGAGFSAAGFFHLLTHGLFKALLFLGAGAVIHAVGSNDLSRMGGLVKRMPQTAVLFIIGSLALAGIPFFGGFLSKEDVLGTVWEGGHVVPFAILMLVAFLTAFYMFRVVFLAFFGAEALVAHAHAAAASSADHASAHGAGHGPGSHGSDGHAAGGHGIPHDPPAVMRLPLWILAVLSTMTGAYVTVSGPELFLGHLEHEPTSPAWLMPAAVAVAGAGIALAWLTYQRAVLDAERLASSMGVLRTAALAKFWMDDAFEAVYYRVFLGFSRMVGWLDRYIVDGVLNVVSEWTVVGGDKLRAMQTGRAQDYVVAVGAGLLAMLIWIGWGR
ncbi:MAG: NADH-quinone oxidoreductase subunit L [Acidimicrobiia bacterium]|nr:NADH-quinone oxidoreductase subunit L [Acidimicrobiia bacterium]